MNKYGIDRDLTGYIGYQRQLRSVNCGFTDNIQVSKHWIIKMYGSYEPLEGHGYAHFMKCFNLIKENKLTKYCTLFCAGSEIRYDICKGKDVFFVRNWNKQHVSNSVSQDLTGYNVHYALLKLNHMVMKNKNQREWLCVDLRRDIFCEDIPKEYVY